MLLERADRTPIASSPEDGLDVAFMDALDRHRQRLPTPLHSRPVNPAARLHVLPGRGDELDLLAVDEAAFLLSVAMAAQPPREEVPSADRARLLQRLAEGRAGSGADIVRRARSVGVDLSRATLWAFHGQRRARAAGADGARCARRRAAGAGGRARRPRPGRAGPRPRAPRRDRGRVRHAAAASRGRCATRSRARSARTSSPRRPGPAVRRGSELGALGGHRARRPGRRAHPAALRRGGARAGRGAGRHRLVEGGGGPPPGDLAPGALRADRHAARRHGVDPDLPQTRVELALEVWAVRMGELAEAGILPAWQA